MIKSKEYLFVDGYNIINAWPDLKDLASFSIEVARQRLIDIMIEYQSYVGLNVIIVFDAYKVKGANQKKEKFGDLEVIYTKENETADTYIERRLDELGRYKKVTVASSDGMLQQMILSRGGLRISAREFYHLVSDTVQEIKRKQEKMVSSGFRYAGTLDQKTIRKLNSLKRDKINDDQ
ncbi:MAG: NYN domain-containing protein [Tissierellales bacterium]|nr:NYN domain-containing protein [Tissierellales bacterium]MBN2827871.1 NYN domain-containing protein [Tissierellales bacterium]